MDTIVCPYDALIHVCPFPTSGHIFVCRAASISRELGERLLPPSRHLNANKILIQSCGHTHVSIGGISHGEHALMCPCWSMDTIVCPYDAYMCVHFSRVDTYVCPPISCGHMRTRVCMLSICNVSIVSMCDTLVCPHRKCGHTNVSIVLVSTRCYVHVGDCGHVRMSTEVLLCPCWGCGHGSVSILYIRVSTLFMLHGIVSTPAMWTRRCGHRCVYWTHQCVHFMRWTYFPVLVMLGL